MPITEQQLEEFLARFGVYPVMRPDATGRLVKGYMWTDTQRACSQAGLPPFEIENSQDIGKN